MRALVLMYVINEHMNFILFNYKLKRVIDFVIKVCGVEQLSEKWVR